MNEFNFIALRTVVSVMAEVRNKLKFSEIKSKFKKTEKGCGSINGRRKEKEIKKNSRRFRL